MRGKGGITEGGTKAKPTHPGTTEKLRSMLPGNCCQEKENIEEKRGDREKKG